MQKLSVFFLGLAVVCVSYCTSATDTTKSQDASQPVTESTAVVESSSDCNKEQNVASEQAAENKSCKPCGKKKKK